MDGDGHAQRPAGQDAVGYALGQGLDEVDRRASDDGHRIGGYVRVGDGVGEVVAGRCASGLDLRLDVHEERLRTGLLLLVHAVAPLGVHPRDADRVAHRGAACAARS